MRADPPVTILPMQSEHVPGVCELAARVPTAPHWPQAEFLRLTQVAAERADRRAAWVALTPEGSVCAFAIAGRIGPFTELEAVVTAPEHRRQGIGLALVHAVLAWSEALEAERLILEVRASNLGAQKLYLRLGFRQDGVRRGYYRSPDEDAVLMSRLLGPPLAG